MKKNKLLSLLLMLPLVACSDGFVDAWSNRTDKFISEEKEIIPLTEQEILEIETRDGIERSNGLKFKFNRDLAIYYLCGTYQEFASLTIPDTYNNLPVTGVWNEAFKDTSSTLTNLHIGKNVQMISAYDLSICSLLATITIDENNEYMEFDNGLLYSLNKQQLTWCPKDNRTEIILPEETNYFDKYSFINATNVASIYLGKDVFGTNIMNMDAFSTLTSLQNISISNENPNYKSVGGILYSKDETVLERYPTGRNGKYAIDEKVTSIAGNAFCGCKFTSVTINKNIQDIDVFAFYDVHNLLSINIDNLNPNYSSYEESIYSKDYSSFLFSPKAIDNIKIHPETRTIKYLENEIIENLIIPDGVTTIERIITPSLKNLILGSGVKNIKSRAFYGSTVFDHVFYKGSVEELALINLGDDNPILVNSKRYFYSEENPSISGHYWRYVDNVPTIW